MANESRGLDASEPGATELRRLERALAASEAGYRDLCENAPLAYAVWDRELRLLRWNRKWIALHRLDSARVREGAPLRDLLPALPPESEASQTAVVRRLFDEGLPNTREFLQPLDDGSSCWLRSHATPIRDELGRVVAVHTLLEDISELHEARDALAANEAELGDLYENAPLAYYVLSADMRLIRWNGRVPEFFGVSPEKLQLGMPVSELVRPTAESAAGFEVAAQVLSDGKYFSTELEYVRLDGGRRWARSHTRALRNEQGGVTGLSSLVEDITEIRRAQHAARESEEQLRALVGGATDGIVAFDASGVIVTFNTAAERLLRCSAAEAIGDSVFRFASAALASAIRGGIETLVGGGVGRPVFLSQGLRFRRRDGAEFASDATLSMATTHGKPVFLAIFRDIEERRKLELAHEALRADNEQLREQIKAIHDFESIVGQSSALAETLEQVSRVAPTQSTVLILGETGTGKELIARAIHARSPRAGKPLVKVNCAALPSGLIESELFGHEKGAFTGATERRVGRFELADGGTLFLDEVGEAPLDVQVKLLRVLQEREFERVGSTQTRRVDVRLIAATNRDLQALVSEGRMRNDLFYRLNVFPVTLPPLRARGDDILLLAHFFLERYAAKLGRQVSRIAPETSERLLAYPWPGNVRELENVIERALILESGRELRIAPAMLPLASDGAARTTPGAADTAPVTLDEIQRRHILATLEASRWRIGGANGAAARLGLAESTLRSQMQRLGIRRA